MKTKHSLFFQEKNPRVDQRKKKLFDPWFLFVIWSNPKSGFQFDYLQSYIFKESFIILTDWLVEPWKIPNCHRWICKVTIIINRKQSCKLFIIPTYFCSISQTNEFHSDVENLIISQILWNTQKSLILRHIRIIFC